MLKIVLNKFCIGNSLFVFHALFSSRGLHRGFSFNPKLVNPVFVAQRADTPKNGLQNKIIYGFFLNLEG